MNLPVLKPMETLETEGSTVLDQIQIRHTICPICSRYRQVNTATGRCHCANNHKHISSEHCPIAHCKRVEAKRG